jgi:hypothetical protein
MTSGNESRASAAPSGMAGLLQTLANFAVIVAGVSVAWLAWQRSQHPAPRLPPTYIVGERIAEVGAVDFQASAQTLVMALREDCRYCQASVPFYRTLTEALRKRADGTTRLVVMSTDSVPAMSAYLKANDIQVDHVAAYRAGDLKIPGTPFLFLVDRAGIVKSVWRGKLATSQEREVFALFGLTAPN